MKRANFVDKEIKILKIGLSESTIGIMSKKLDYVNFLFCVKTPLFVK